MDKKLIHALLILFLIFGFPLFLFSKAASANALYGKEPTWVSNKINNITNPSQSYAQPITICSGALIKIDGDDDTPVAGRTYQWQYLVGASWQPAPGTNNDMDYLASGLVNNTSSNIVYHIRRQVITSGTVTYDSPYDVTVQPANPIVNNTITSPTSNTFCTPANPGTITGTTATGGDGNPQYQWQSSTDGSNFTDIAAATGQSYTPTNLSQPMYFQRVVTAGSCVSSTASNIVKITVDPAITNNFISATATNFCVSGNPGTFTGSTPSGGDGLNYAYQWQSSTDGINFSDITSATSATYAPGTLTTTTYFRRNATSGPCTTPSPSNVITINISPAITNNSINAPAITTLCNSGSPGTITGSMPSGGDGSGYTYQWQSSTNGVNFTDISGANSINYDPGTVTSTTFYRRTITGGGCSLPPASNVVTITVQPAITNNTITAPAVATFCTTGDPSVINGTTPSGGNGAYAYQWQSSTDGVNFTAISGANSANYDPGTLSQTTYFQRMVTSGSCTTPSPSNVVTITITPAINNNTINNPATISFCGPSSAQTITGNAPAGGNGTYAYQWQSSTDGVTFTDIAGANSIDYTTPVLSQTTYYQRTVTSGNCISPPSNVVVINVQPSVNNNTISSPSTAYCSNISPAAITGSTPTGGNNIYTYQWQSSTDGSTFTDISGATSKDYTPPQLSSNIYYRRTVTSGYCNVPVYSNVIGITITTALSNNNLNAPAANLACGPAPSQTLTGTIPSGGNGTLNYQWQSSADGVSFTDIAGANSATYPTGTLSATTYYRRAVTSGACTTPSFSNTVVINVQSFITNNNISSPVLSYCSNTTPLTITGTIPAGGSGTYAYQWQSSADGTVFNDISGATSPDYSPGNLSATTYFRRVVTSGNCSAPDYSNAVEITITPVITSNIINNPAITQSCGSAPAQTITGPTPTGGNGNFTYQWQSSVDSTNFTSISGATSASYTTPIVTTTTYYRRSVTSGACTTPVISDTVTIIIQSSIDNNNITSTGTTAFCSTGIPGTINGSTPTGGDGNYTYQWQSSSNNISFNDINGANGVNYSPGSVSATTYFRRMVTSGYCATPNPSNVVTITVTPLITSNTINTPAPASFCGPPGAVTITGNSPAGGTGSYTYQWQSSTNNVTFTDIAGATSVNYTTPSLTGTMYYQRQVTSGACATPVNSNVITISVQPELANNTINPPAVTSFCSNGDPAVITGSTPTGGSNTYVYQWQTSPDNLHWFDIPGANSIDFDPSAVGAAAYYRRAVTSGNCSTALISNTVAVYVTPSVTNNVLTAPNIVASCGPAPAQTITGSTATGGDGNYTYQWQSSTNGINFTDIAGQNGLNYTTPVLNVTTYYQRTVVSGGCTTPLVSNIITINVQSAIQNNSISSPSTAYCSDTPPATLTGSTPTGGDGTYAYQWQSAIDNVNFTNISGATAKDFTPPQLSVNTYFRRTVTSGNCAAPNPSNSILITITPAITNNTIIAPPASTFCGSSPPQVITGVTPQGGNGTFTYQWQSSTDDVTFTNIPGATGPTYTTPELFSPTYFRRLAISGACTTPQPSNVVPISVQTPLGNNNITTATNTDCSNVTPAIINGSIPTGGDGTTYAYQWFSSTDNVTYTIIPGATGQNYQPGVLALTTYFERKVTSGTCYGPSPSNIVQVLITTAIASNNINAPAIISSCGPVASQTINGDAATGGNGIIAYQWQSSTDGTNFTDIAGQNGLSYTTPALNNTMYYRREATSGACTIPAISNVVTINIEQSITNNNVSPSSATYCSNEAPSVINGSTPTGGNGTYTYQWQNSTDGSSFNNIAGANNINYTPPATPGVVYYRRMVTSGYCSVIPSYSTTVTVSVTTAITDNTITPPAVTNFCSSAPAQTITGNPVSGGNGTVAYQWQSSADGVNYTNISGETGVSYTTPVLTATMYYHRTVTSGACTTPDISNAVEISVQPQVANNSISTPVLTYCGTTVPALITGTTPTGGSSTYTYQWQSSANGTVFTDIAGANSRDYTPPATSGTISYRREVVSGNCNTANISNVITITITPAITNYNINDPAIVSCGAVPAQTITGNAASGGNGVFAYQWQSSVNGTNFTDITGANSVNYTTPALSSTMYYRREVTSGACTTPQVSNVVEINVQPVLANYDINAPALTLFCNNGDAALITGNVPTGGNGTYAYQWQNSTDGSNFSDIAGATGVSYDPPATLTTMFYRREVTSGNCTTPQLSSVVTIIVTPLPGNNSITAPTIIASCGPVAAQTIIGSVANGGNGTFTYQWQSSTDGQNFSDIPGANGINYTTPPLNSTMYYRRNVTSGACVVPMASNIIEINVQQDLANNAISPITSNYCATSVPVLLTGTTPTGGDGTYAYQWQSSTDNSNFTDIAGATSRDYLAPAVITTTYYRRAVVTGNCTTPRVSNVATISITPAITSNVINNPTITTACGPAPAETIVGNTPVGGTNIYTYQWQSSTNGTTYTDIAGATGISYTTSASNQTMYYRRNITSGACTTPAPSNVVTINVQPVLAVNSNTITAPATSTFCNNGDADVIAGSQPTGGSGTYTYQWQNSVDNTNFNDITGANGINYDPPATTSTMFYRRSVTSGNCTTPIISNVVSIIVTPQPANNNITAPTITASCGPVAAQTITGSTPTGGSGTFNYQWQSSTDGHTFTDIAGANGPSYTTLPLSSTMYYQRLITSGNCNTAVPSNVVQISVQPRLDNNTISTSTINYCSGATLVAITGSTPTGGTGTYAYQWQSSTDGINFTDILNANGINYMPSAIAGVTYYRRAVTSGNCMVPLFSSPVSISVTTAIASNHINDPGVASCGAVGAQTITGDPATGGNGVYAYQWQSSPDGLTFVNIAGANGPSYTTPPLNSTMYYQRLVTSGNCNTPLPSNVVAISVQQPLNNNTISSSILSYCSDATLTAVIGSTPTGGSGTYAYQWQSSADGTTYTDIAGANGINYTPSAISGITYYRRMITSGNCNTPYPSNVVSISVTQAIAVNSNTINNPNITVSCGTVAAQTITGSTPTGGNGTFNYQWRSSTDGNIFTDIAGANGATYTTPALTTTMYYQRVVTSGACTTPQVSNVVEISAQPVITNNNISSAVTTYCAGTTLVAITGTTPAGGNNTYTYQWQSAADGITFTDIAGANGINYTPSATSGITYYRRTVTSGNCNTPSPSAAVAISVTNPVTNNTITAPAATMSCGPVAPQTITGSIPAGGNNNFTYQWQSSTNGTNFMDITGATSADYTTGTVSTTTYYRRNVTSGNCAPPVSSAAVVITVEAVIATNTISAPAAYCSTDAPPTITGSGNSTYAYQWQSATDGINFTNIASATSRDYTPAPLTAITYFRRVVTSGYCTATSNIISISVTSPVANNTITAPSATTFCGPSIPETITGSTPTGGDSHFIYQWQSSADGITYTDIAGANAANYQIPVLNAVTYFRRTVTSGGCTTPSLSNPVMINVQQMVAGNTITAPNGGSICGTTDPGLITGSTPTGGSGTYTYQWESSTDNSNFTPVANSNVKDYDPGVLSVTTYFRRTVTSGNCITPVISTSVKITVLPAITNTINAPAVTSFCAPANPLAITGNAPTGGNGTFTYQWQSAEDNATFTDITGATAANYTPVGLNNITYFRRLVSAGGCTTPLASNVVTIMVSAVPAVPVPVQSTVTICAGSTISLAVSSPVAGVTYNWYNSPAKTTILGTGATFVTPVLNNNTIFYVEALNGSCAAPSTAAVTVNVLSSPSVPQVTATAVSTCSGSPAILSVTSPQSGVVYNWYQSATGGTAAGTGTTFTTPALTASTTYYVEAANTGGCTSPARTAVNVTVNPLPQVTAQGTSVCPGSTATLTATANVAGASISWYANATGGTTLFTGSTFTTPAINSNINYYVEVTNTATGCTAATRLPVQVSLIQPLPAPVVSAESFTASTVTFDWSAVAGATGYLVSTDGGKTFTAPSSGATGLTHTVTGLQINESVTIVVKALGATDCETSANSTAVTATAKVLSDDIYVANAFTPNGDGKNDIMYVHSPNIRTMTLYVYSQWGELLFETTNLNAGWDGTYKGNQEPVGVYVYYVKAIMNDGREVNKKGTITLLR